MMVKSIRLLVASLGFVVALSACVYDPHYHYPPGQRYHSYYYPYYYDYFYYPGVQVYFHFSTGYYYYYSRNRWIRSKVLPPHIHLNPWDRVTLRIAGDKPYLKHKEHKQKFKPRPRPPAYQVIPRDSKSGPVGEAVRGSIKKRPGERDVPRMRPGTGDTSRVRPGKPPVDDRDYPYSKREREHNLKLYQHHKKDQEEYQKEWKEREWKEKEGKGREHKENDVKDRERKEREPRKMW